MLFVALCRHAPAPASAEVAQAVSAHHRSNAVVACIADHMNLKNLFEQHGVGLALRERLPFRSVVATAARPARGLHSARMGSSAWFAFMSSYTT